MNVQLGEINIFCTDLAQSLDFYCNVLGFEKVEEEDGAVRLRCGDRPILLLPFAERVGSAEAYGTHATVSFDLYVDDIAQTVAHLQRHQVQFERPLQQDRHVFIRDPDNLVLEIIERRQSL